MGRRRKYPLIEKVEITALGSEGKSLAKVDDQVVFVTQAIPGDVVDIQVTKKKKILFRGKGYPFSFLL